MAGSQEAAGSGNFTTRGESPIGLDIAHAAPGFAEALQLMHQGEKMVLWVPPSESTPEAVVYEIEVVGIVAPPAVANGATNGGAAARGAGPH